MCFRSPSWERFLRCSMRPKMQPQALTSSPEVHRQRNGRYSDLSIAISTPGRSSTSRDNPKIAYLFSRLPARFLSPFMSLSSSAKKLSELHESASPRPRLRLMDWRARACFKKPDHYL